MVRSLRGAALTVLIFAWAAWVFFSQSTVPLLISIAIIIHECGHFLTSMLFENRFKKISLQNGGFLLSGNAMYNSYFSEGVIAFAGPFFNLISALAFLSARDEAFVFFRNVSLALALLNLLPVKEFDGGRIACCVFSSLFSLNRAQKLCGILSFLATYFIWSISVYIVMKTGRNTSALIFSFMIFLKIIPKASDNRICEIIGE